ncbi:MAG: hypothetical protein ACRYGR_04700 [Janthinobacterium lividum]
MPILYRHQKGSPLTTEEVDGNFYEIVSRLESLEQKTTQNESIIKVEQKGDQLDIIGSFGSILGEVKLPTLKYNLRGKWVSETSYAVQDVVTHRAQTWVCVTAHTSVPEFDANSWQLLLDASENLRPLSLPSQMPVFLNDTLPTPVLGHVGVFGQRR